MSAPFGIEFNSPLAKYTVLQDLGMGAFIVEAPNPHPLFETYLARATSSLGVVWVKGLGPIIENDNFGTATKAAVDRVADQLALKYGKAKRTDFLTSGSIWTDPQDWMSALNVNERYYSATWQKPAQQLPEDLASIYVGASGTGGREARVIVEYGSPSLEAAELELEQGMADLL